MQTIEPLNFNEYPQPEWNEPDSVRTALEAVEQAHDEYSSNEAYDRLLWAIGNNHAGTYFPVVLAVAPQLEQILHTGTIWSQLAALESLIDLGGSFVLEPGHESHHGVYVKEALRAFIISIRPTVALLVGSSDAVSRCASELIELIDDQSA